MFVEYLNKKQQAVLLHFAHKIMMVDGTEEAAESALMDVLRRQVVPGVRAESAAIDELPNLFVDRRSRIAFILETLGMAYADEEFEPDESNLLHKLARALMLEGEMETFKSWIVRQFLLINEAHLLMED